MVPTGSHRRSFIISYVRTQWVMICLKLFYRVWSRFSFWRLNHCVRVFQQFACKCGYLIRCPFGNKQYDLIARCLNWRKKLKLLKWLSTPSVDAFLCWRQPIFFNQSLQVHCVRLCRDTFVFYVMCSGLHLLNVLTDHFSNSLPEKTAKDIPLKFSQCPFNTIFNRLPFSNRGIYFPLIHVRRNAVFYVLRHVHRVR